MKRTSLQKEEEQLFNDLLKVFYHSSDMDERNLQKQRLEKKAARSSNKLSDLIAIHSEDLTQVFNCLDEIPVYIEHALTELDETKRDIVSCRKFLNLNRELIYNTWIECHEVEYTVHNLEKLEELSDIVFQFEEYMNTKHYENAIKLILHGKNMLKGPIHSLPVLSIVRKEFAECPNIMFQHLIVDINREVYHHSIHYLIDSLKNYEPDLFMNPFEQNAKERDLIGAYISEQEGFKPEDDTRHFISNMVHCLMLLNLLPKAMAELERTCLEEMTIIVLKTPHRLMKVYPNLRMLKHMDSGKSTLLGAFFKLIFEQVEAVLAMHQWIGFIIEHLGRFQPLDHYSTKRIWAKLQLPIEEIMADYLDTQRARHVHTGANHASFNIHEISNTYFTKKKTIKKTLRLFKFSRTTHALGIKMTEDQETMDLHQEDDSILPENHYYLCDPDKENVLFIHRQTMHFIANVEHTMSFPRSNDTEILQILNDHVENFIIAFKKKLTKDTNAITNNFKDWKHLNDSETHKELHMDVPVLISTLDFFHLVQSVERCIERLPEYDMRFYVMLTAIMSSYKDACSSGFTYLVEVIPGIKSLSAILESKAKMTCALIDPFTEMNEKSLTLAKKSLTEACLQIDNLIFRNINDMKVDESQIIPDMHNLAHLSMMHESLKWFSKEFRKFLTRLPKYKVPLLSDHLEDFPHIQSKEIDFLKHAIYEFSDLADVCYRVLFIEMKTQCICYLSPIEDLKNYALRYDNHEPDPEVKEMVKDLEQLNELMKSTLTPIRSRLLFEGLEECLAAIFKANVGALSHFNTFGIKKLRRNIVTTEVALQMITQKPTSELEHILHFYGLLFHNPKQILTKIIKDGPEFREIDYANIFKLIHRNAEEYDHDLINREMSDLAALFGELKMASRLSRR